jgi:hypothetical protein
MATGAVGRGAAAPAVPAARPEETWPVGMRVKVRPDLTIAGTDRPHPRAGQVGVVEAARFLEKVERLHRGARTTVRPACWALRVRFAPPGSPRPMPGLPPYIAHDALGFCGHELIRPRAMRGG